jgi:hypothetical protein
MIKKDYKKILENKGVDIDGDALLIAGLDSDSVYYISPKAEAIIGQKYNEKESWSPKDLFLLPLKLYIEKPKENFGSLNLIRKINGEKQFVQITVETVLIGQEQVSLGSPKWNFKTINPPLSSPGCSSSVPSSQASLLTLFIKRDYRPRATD